MIDGGALDADRLPWLTDEPQRPRTGRGSRPWLLGAAALLTVAGGSYWAGRIVESGFADGPRRPEAPGETIRLERAKPAPGAAEPAERPVPVIEPVRPSAAERSAAEPDGELAPVPKAESRKSAKHSSAKRLSAKRSSAKQASARRAVPKRSAKRAAASRSALARKAPRRARAVPHWPRPADAVALGRMVRLGTYSSVEKNHRAWLSALNRYPQVRGLPKITGAYRAANGRTYYPLYVMTTARAQSDWLCRRLRRDWRSCTVMGA